MSPSVPLSASGLIALLAFAPSLSAQSAQSAAFFDDNCAPCHTIGGGEQGGPDLKWVTQRHERQWLIRFILDPDAMVASGDPRAADMIKHWDGAVMPKIPELTPQLAESILQFIDTRSNGAAAPSEGATPPPAYTQADVDRGRVLFAGGVRSANGAPPCIACHSIAGEGGMAGGGRLGVDLTLVSARLRGPQGVSKWLEAPPTPMMRALIRRAPLTPDDNRALTAFFEAVRTRQPSPPASRTMRFAGAGAGGALVVMLAIGVVWRNRSRGVRRPLVTRASVPVRRGGDS